MLFEIARLTKRYRDRTVLDVQRLDIEKGAIYGLQGPNGAGKTTLLNILALLESPTTGTVSYKSQPVQYSEPYLQRLRKEVVLVDQLPLLFTTSVFKNMEFGLKIRGIANEERKRRIFKGLEMVGMEDFVDAPAHQLSGGETQRVAVAARLVLKPEILLLDEPTANVDIASAQQIREAALMARRKWNTTLVIASHDRDWLYDVCDQVTHLFKGRLFGTGKENILFGPWRLLSGNLWEKQLPDGQSIRLYDPPESNAVAILESLTIANGVDFLPADADTPILNGIVLRLTLEKNSTDSLATILIGTLPLTLKIPRQKIQQDNLYPGQKVTLSYNPHSVKWL
ncbi:MAG: energy-coupling factor ABC transporter ATP-binding protein [Deltaproteobacteria bacterium]|nr:energy-coupling factor ABC transporter ATP-binding protein [Deltaproteobacteria bacterium]